MTLKIQTGFYVLGIQCFHASMLRCKKIFTRDKKFLLDSSQIELWNSFFFTELFFNPTQSHTQASSVLWNMCKLFHPEYKVENCHVLIGTSFSSSFPNIFLIYLNSLRVDYTYSLLTYYQGIFTFSKRYQDVHFMICQ